MRSIRLVRSAAKRESGFGERMRFGEAPTKARPRAPATPTARRRRTTLRPVHLVPAAAKDRHKTAFICSLGLFEFTVMSFGATKRSRNVPAHDRLGPPQYGRSFRTTASSGAIRTTKSLGAPYTSSPPESRSSGETEEMRAFQGIGPLPRPHHRQPRPRLSGASHRHRRPSFPLPDRLLPRILQTRRIQRHPASTRPSLRHH